MIALEQAFADSRVPFLRSAPLAGFSTFRIGGIADYILLPEDAKTLIRAARLCRQNDLPLAVAGNGSNLLFADSGFRGAVLVTKKINRVLPEPDGFFAGCGALLPGLSRRAAERGLSGLEFACAIPGTVGGAVCMNAGAHGGEMAQIVTRTEYYDLKTDTCGDFSGKKHRFGYRTSIFAGQPEKIILGAHLVLQKGEHEAILHRMEENAAFRRTTPPIGEPSAGSAFKRPKTGSAAELIDRCGLKGLSVGGAMISKKHAGFIVNFDHATAKDVANLIEQVQTVVLQKTGILLEPEIRIVGKI